MSGMSGWPGPLSSMPYMQPAPWFANLNPLPSLSAGLTPAGYQAALQSIAPSGYLRSQGGYGYDAGTGIGAPAAAASAPAAPGPMSNGTVQVMGGVPAALSPSSYGAASAGGSGAGYGALFSPAAGGGGGASMGASGMMPVSGDPFATMPLSQALLTGNMGFGPEMWSQVRLMNDQLTAQSPFATQAQKDTAAQETAAGPMMVMAPTAAPPLPDYNQATHNGRA